MENYMLMDEYIFPMSLEFRNLLLKQNNDVIIVLITNVFITL